MSDPNWQPTEPGDPGAPRDVNRPEDVVWTGREVPGNENDPERADAPKKATKATKSAAKSEDDKNE